MHLLRAQWDHRADEASCSSRTLAGQIKMGFSMLVTIHQPARDGARPFHTTNLLVFETFPICQKTQQGRADPRAWSALARATQCPPGRTQTRPASLKGKSLAQGLDRCRAHPSLAHMLGKGKLMGSSSPGHKNPMVRWGWLGHLGDGGTPAQPCRVPPCPRRPNHPLP